MEPAPFHRDVAEAPEGEAAVWLTTADGLRLRAAFWRGGGRGTAVIFPGRTEYLEKYGRTAGELLERGFSVAVIDWRGQGLSPRLLDDPRMGHVGHFLDYQRDADALVAALARLDLPRPWGVIGHSMGGTIALRALHRRLAADRFVFSAPMWGLLLSPKMRPLAWALSGASVATRRVPAYAPTTGPLNYALTAPFEGNTLTGDAGNFATMVRQMTVHPELSLGGPGLHWVWQALRETRRLRAMTPPRQPVLTLLGSDERVVDVPAIRGVMRRWPGGLFELVPQARHELLAEVPAIRTHVLDCICRFIEGGGDAVSSAAAPPAGTVPSA